ncbi:LysR family transcriptional regulator [Photobacterium sp. GSS17]|uniref:LysR family transcriptional regulator n=1 Tax=Photobacterium sp. GSS17 TaxID=3020715 RepID=UPI00236141EF|nr:LysR family transcriptional regulator [Photobacterium sp. GSS17]
MNLRQIEVFYAIMKAGSISGAAKQLHVSQPNVTRVLAHTEQQLGFPLFHRHKGRLIATDSALRLLPEAEKVYLQLGSLQSLTSKLQKGHQHLRIGAPPVLASTLLPPVIKKLCQNPAVSVDLSTDNRGALCQALLQNEIDVVVSFGRDIPPGTCGTVILESEMVALLPATAAMSVSNGSVSVSSALMEGESSVSLDELVLHGERIIGLDSRDPLGIQISQAIKHIAPDYHHQVTVRSYMAAAKLVCEGMGTAIVDPWTASYFTEKLITRTLSPAIPVSLTCLVAEHTPISDTARQFQLFLSQQTQSTQ